MQNSDGQVPLIRVTRSGVQDKLHRGSVVVVDDHTAPLMTIGDPQTCAYIRSAAKPIQCIPVITCGAADAFGLDDRDIAIISGSHRGGAEQVAQVRSILAKCGLSEEHLQSGAGITDNCSGKHAGMLAACKHQELSLDSYTDPQHPHQLAIVEVLRNVCCLDDGEVHVGIDGCSAPIHYFSIDKMALGYARMSVPGKHFDPATAAAVERIIQAMWTAPEGHTGEPLYRELFAGGPRLLTKSGGYGVYCAGLVGKGIGFAMKVEDGDRTALIPVFNEVMRRLGVFSDTEADHVAGRFIPEVRNRRGRRVGALEILV